MESRRVAIRDVRSGSPGRRMYSARSPRPSPMWYCRSPSGIAIRRSLGLSTRVSAFGKTSPSLTWLLRWRETRPRIGPCSCVSQAWLSVDDARPATLSPRTAPDRATFSPRRAAARRPHGPRRSTLDGASAPPNEDSRAATRAASNRRAWRRRRRVTPSDARLIPTSDARPAPAPGSAPRSSPNPADRGRAAPAISFSAGLALTGAGPVDAERGRVAAEHDGGGIGDGHGEGSIVESLDSADHVDRVLRSR